MAGMPYGLQAMLKDGYKHMSGLSEAVMKNLEACQELSKITRTSLGPNGTERPKLAGQAVSSWYVSSFERFVRRRHEQDHHQSPGPAFRHK
jgi:hypothetical protein